MSLWRFAVQARWLGYLALAVAFAIITALFGLWQWDRREQAVAEIDRVVSNYDAEPIPLEQALPALQPWDEALKWRPVIVSGRYIAESELLVRTRPRFGSVGFDIVTVLERAEGGYVLINRGWVPTGASQDEPDFVPPVPTGTVSVVARLMPGEPLIGGRGAPEGQVATINLDEIAGLTGLPIDKRFFLALEGETPRPEVVPLVPQRPSLDEGPHLSYTFQWFLFGALGFVAWAYLLWDDYRRQGGHQALPSRKKQPSDQDVEDLLIDQSEKRVQASDTNSA